MTVRELIEKLEMVNPDATVLINNYDSQLDVVDVVTSYVDEPVIIETVGDD